MTEPNPEFAEWLRQVKAAMPPDRTHNHNLLDYLISVQEHGISDNQATQGPHLSHLLNLLTLAHLETTGIALGG